MVKRRELVDDVVDRAGVAPETVDTVLDVFFEVLAERLMDGEAFNVPRFATFKPVQRAARTARNVLTREVIHVAPQRTVKLVVSDHLKRRLNEDVE